MGKTTFPGTRARCVEAGETGPNSYLEPLEAAGRARAGTHYQHAAAAVFQAGPVPARITPSLPRAPIYGRQGCVILRRGPESGLRFRPFQFADTHMACALIDTLPKLAFSMVIN
jgi:hypothetical protein